MKGKLVFSLVSANIYVEFFFPLNLRQHKKVNKMRMKNYDCDFVNLTEGVERVQIACGGVAKVNFIGLGKCKRNMLLGLWEKNP